MIGNSRKSAGMTGAIEGGLVNLESLYPFAAIDHLEHGSTVPLIENGNLEQFDFSSGISKEIQSEIYLK